MSDEKSSDKIARGMAIVSLLVAIAAVVVPYMQQRSQFQALQNEELVVRLNSSMNGPLRLTENSFGPKGHVVQIPWQVTLSNTGYQNLSISKYSITVGASPNSTYYSGVDGGMFTSDQQRVQLPFTLEPGESRSFRVLVGIIVPPRVYEVLSSIDGKLSEARMVLAKQGVDLYGNEVNYQEFEGGSYLITLKKGSDKSPIYWFEVVTGRGNVFVTSETAYRWPE